VLNDLWGTLHKERAATKGKDVQERDPSWGKSIKISE
jgi:hypothetical protein